MSDGSEARRLAAARSASFQVPTGRRGGRLGWLAAVLFGLATALTWGLALGAGRVDLPYASSAILAFLPWVAVGLLVVGFLLWTVIPDRGSLAFWLSVALLAPAVHWGPSWPADPDEAAGDPLRLVTWNVRRLWGGPDDGGDATACVVETLGGFEADVLVLQEVTRADVDTLSAPLRLDCAWGAYRVSDSERASGIAVCALGDWRLVEGGPRGWEDDGGWRQIEATLAHGTTRLDVVGVHYAPYGILRDPLAEIPRASTRLGEVGARQAAQTDALLALAAARTHPLVVAGDFNSSRDEVPHARLRRVLTDVWDRGATGMAGTVRLMDWLPVRIDHVYASEDVGVAAAAVPTTGCSDHRPVVTDLHVP